MKSNKIKLWARIGAIAFWIAQVLYVVWEMQYTPFESAGTKAVILSFACLAASLIFTEAIVRLIGYFAELLERK